MQEILLRSNFNYNDFPPEIRPSPRRLSNYNSMPLELITDNTGYVQNPFQENGKRFICFEALRRNISFERLAGLLKLDEEEKILTRRTYLQVKKCYFSTP